MKWLIGGDGYLRPAGSELTGAVFLATIFQTLCFVLASLIPLAPGSLAVKLLFLVSG